MNRTENPIDAIEVAVLVKRMDSITDAARLIDNYAACVAAGAKIEGHKMASDRVLTALNGSKS